MCCCLVAQVKIQTTAKLKAAKSGQRDTNIKYSSSNRKLNSVHWFEFIGVTHWEWGFWVIWLTVFVTQSVQESTCAHLLHSPKKQLSNSFILWLWLGCCQRPSESVVHGLILVTEGAFFPTGLIIQPFSWCIYTNAVEQLAVAGGKSANEIIDTKIHESVKAFERLLRLCITSADTDTKVFLLSFSDSAVHTVFHTPAEDMELQLARCYHIMSFCCKLRRPPRS